MWWTFCFSHATKRIFSIHIPHYMHNPKQKQKVRSNQRVVVIMIPVHKTQTLEWFKKCCRILINCCLFSLFNIFFFFFGNAHRNQWNQSVQNSIEFIHFGMSYFVHQDGQNDNADILLFAIYVCHKIRPFVINIFLQCKPISIYINTGIWILCAFHLSNISSNLFKK